MPHYTLLLSVKAYNHMCVRAIKRGYFILFEINFSWSFSFQDYNHDRKLCGHNAQLYFISKGTRLFVYTCD